MTADPQARAAAVLAAQYEAFRREHAALGTKDSPDGFAARFAPGAAAALAEAGLLTDCPTHRRIIVNLRDQRDAARAQLAQEKATLAGLRRVHAETVQRLADAERRGAVAALREAAADPALRLSGHSGISITRLRARADRLAEGHSL